MEVRIDPRIKHDVIRYITNYLSNKKIEWEERTDDTHLIVKGSKAAIEQVTAYERGYLDALVKVEDTLNEMKVQTDETGEGQGDWVAAAFKKTAVILGWLFFLPVNALCVMKGDCHPLL